MARTWGIPLVAAVLLALVAGAGVAAWRVSSDADRAAAADDLEQRQEDRDTVAEDVERSEAYLEELEASLGASPVPVRDTVVEPPQGVQESLFTPNLAVGDFEDVFVDEGIVLRGLDAKEVDEVAMRPADTYPRPTPRPPLTAKPGFRLVQVDLLVTNRTGDAADPACGIGAGLIPPGVDDQGERVRAADETYATAATYPTSCGDGIADGASGRVRVALGLPEDRRLAALELSFLGEGDSDSMTQVLVFDEPV